MSLAKGSGLMRTVRGDFPPQQLGYCQAHEHLFVHAGPASEKKPDLLPMLRTQGVPASALSAMTLDNPARALAWRNEKE